MGFLRTHLTFSDAVKRRGIRRVWDYGASILTVRRKTAAFMYEISILLLKFIMGLSLSWHVRFTAECVIHCLLILQRSKVFQGWRIIWFENKCSCNWQHSSVGQADTQEMCSYFSGWSRRFAHFFILVYSWNSLFPPQNLPWALLSGATSLKKMTFDDILEEINGLGPFQIALLVLFCIPRIVLPCHFLLNNFIAALPPHHCDFSSLDSGGLFRNLTQEQRLTVSVPVRENGAPEACEMFALPQVQLLGNTTNSTGLPTVPCQSGWIYDNSSFASSLAIEVRGDLSAFSEVTFTEKQTNKQTKTLQDAENV